MAKTKQRFLTLEALQLVADRFKVLADPLRLNLLQSLEDGEMSVNQLTEAVGASQPNVSKHLKILQDAGFVGRRQQGNSVYYSIADSTIYKLCDLMCHGLQQRLAAQSNIFTDQPPRPSKPRG